MKVIKLTATIIGLVVLTGCGNPGGISDEDYEKYKSLAAPKILYSCTDSKMGESGNKVGYIAGVGFNATYNKILEEIDNKCNYIYSGKLKILKSEK